MHRQHPSQRQQIGQNREDGLLDLPCVGRIPNDTQALSEIYRNKRLRLRSINLRKSLKRWDGENGEVRNVVPILLAVARQYEHVTGEEAMPCVFGDDADWHPVLSINTNMTILNENILAL